MFNDPCVTGYDIVGDVHGCLDALKRLAVKLGYGDDLTPPTHRRMIFVGDLCDRGPENVATLSLVCNAVSKGFAVTVLGNHDDALRRRLRGEPYDSEVGSDSTWAEIVAWANAATLKASLLDMLMSAPLVLELAGGNFIVAHAGITDAILRNGLDSEGHEFVLHGEQVGKSPEGRTMRKDWAADYRGRPFIVYGHTPQPIAVIRGRTANVDTGAYCGNLLSALRWPELEIVAVSAA